MSGPFLPGYDEWLEQPYDEQERLDDNDGPDPDELRERWIDRQIDKADQERARKKDER